MMNKKRFTGLEIEGSYVKLAQAEDSAGGRKIIKLIVRESASQSEADIAQALRTIIGQLKGQIGHLTLSIPHHKVIVRFLRFPSVNEKEIEGMVGLQSAKELPFSKEEIISDYLIVERTKEGYAEVALVIAHRDVINGYLGILKKANLRPERITFSAEAVLNWYSQAFRQKGPPGCSILIDLDSDNTDIVILANSRLAFTRGLSLGTVQLSKQADLKGKLAEEIRHTIAGYNRQKTPRKIEKIFLAGEVTESLKAFLQQEFSLPCEIVDPLKNLSCKREVSAVGYESGLSLLRVLGMALDVKERRLNLLPADLRQRQELKARRKRVCTTLILSSGIILLGLLGFAKEIHDKQLYMLYLDREINETAPLAQEVENIFRKIELIEARREISGSSIDVLRQLHNLIPQNISLSSFSCDEENKTLTVQGTSTNLPEIFELINSMEKTAYFKNVQLKYVSEKKLKAGGFTNFEIECGLEK